MKKMQRKLPKGWRWEKIGDHISNFQSGLACGEKSKNTGHPHLRMNNISKEFKLDLDLLWKIPATDKEIEKYSVQKGDLLFNNTNSSELVGKSCLFEIKSNDKFLFSNHLTKIQTKRTMSSKYLLYWISFLWLKRYFKDNCDKWVNQAAARAEDVLFPHVIPFPPTYDEQIAIANKLESKMADIEKMRQAALRQKEAVDVFREALLRRYFPYEEGDSLPKGWQWYELGDILKFKNGINFSSSEVGQGTLTVDVFNMYTENLYPKLNNLYRVNKNISNEYLLKEDDILFVRSSVKKEGVGWPTVFKGYKEPVSFCGFIIRGRLLRDGIDPKYLVLYSRMASVREKFISASGQTTITNISQDNLKRVKIPVANKMSEQKEIVQKIETRLLGIETLQHASERQSEAIQALPAAILREVFDFQEANA
ncbi:MAG: restriction endonuclease subunit S [Pseudomonadota bacterium]